MKEKLKENGILVEEDGESAENGQVEEEKAEVMLNGHAGVFISLSSNTKYRQSKFCIIVSGSISLS